MSSRKPDFSTTFLIVNFSTTGNYYSLKQNSKVYIKMFKLFGCVRIDLTKFDGSNFGGTCGNFATSYNIKKTQKVENQYSILLESSGGVSGLFSIINFDEIDDL